jgi:hypothetical protein
VKTAAPTESTKAEEKSKKKSPREALLSQYADTVKRPKDSPPFFRLFNIRPGYKCRISEGARFLLAPTEGDSAIRMGNKYPDLLHYFCGDDDTEDSHMWAYFTKGSEEVDFFTLTPHELECKCEEVKTDIVANQIICSQCTTANVEGLTNCKICGCVLKEIKLSPTSPKPVEKDEKIMCECGLENNVKNTVCEYCDRALIPLGAVNLGKSSSVDLKESRPVTKNPVPQDVCPFERLDGEAITSWKSRLESWWNEQLLQNLAGDKEHFLDARNEYAKIKISKMRSLNAMKRVCVKVKNHLLAYAPALCNNEKFKTVYQIVNHLMPNAAETTLSSPSPKSKKNSKRKIQNLQTPSKTRSSKKSKTQRTQIKQEPKGANYLDSVVLIVPESAKNLVSSSSPSSSSSLSSSSSPAKRTNTSC